MTLNVTVLTQAIIYQSADFRLTDLETGDFITDSSAKTVNLIFPSWNGFVTYTGVGVGVSRHASSECSSLWSG